MYSTDMTKTLQNTLRLLKLWFRHGSLTEIEKIVKDGFEKIDLKIWINVIP
jgi:FKBP12-rapamycin complex-associated protein